MALAVHECQHGVVPCYANPAVACGGAEFRAQSRHLATLLSISGAIDDTNVDLLYERGGGFVLPGTGCVLDLSGVTTFAAEGILMLSRLDEACRTAGVEWALVASRPVAERLGGFGARYPFAASVPDALQRFADGIFARRRMLLPYLTKSA